MLKRMNSPRKPGAAASAPRTALVLRSTTHCPPLPLEIWTQIMRTLVHSEDLPELWTGLRLLSHTLKAAVETAFVDEHLSRMRGWLYVGDPHQLEMRRSNPWNNNNNHHNNNGTSNANGSTTTTTSRSSSAAQQSPGKRIVPLQLVLTRFSPDRRRAYFVSLLHRNDPSLQMSPRFAECTDNTVVAEWLRSARGVPPPGAGPTEGRLRLTIGPDCAWTHWKHHVIGSDGFVVESRNITFEDDDGEGAVAGAGVGNGDKGRGDGARRKVGGRGKGNGNGNGSGKRTAAEAIGLEVDRARCEVSLEWMTLVSSVFARPRKTFGEQLRS
ncbi:hypothetical protein GGR54DRAFT_643262 [Hypoxylon sp. NC1633]|nr:hypothetical protein GGR54DRAFT_643262 [Hypoxylon sp. NC1633]